MKIDTPSQSSYLGHVSDSNKVRSLPALPSKARGSIVVQFAIFLSVTILILAVVDFGYAFYAKRDLQRIADLAALEAAQALPFKETSRKERCSPVLEAGQKSIAHNWPAPLNQTSTPQINCIYWSPSESKPPFNQTTLPNAAHVVLEGESPRFIPGPWSRIIHAEAVAQRDTPSAAFQIGSQLLNLDKSAPLGKILSLVGVDADRLTVLDSDGLANAKISPSGLLKALGVNLGIDGLGALTPNQLVDLNNLTLLQILNASLEVVSDNTAKADLRAVIDILRDAKIESVRLLDLATPPLGSSSENTPGIFTFLSLGKNSSPNGAALDTEIGIGQMIKTAILVAAGGHTLQVKDTGLVNDTVKISLTVVEAPSVAFGSIGMSAKSAQIRANIDVDSSKLPALGKLLDLLGLRINLPIKIEGVTGTATLEDVYCPDPDRGNQPSIDLGVVSNIAKIVIGDTSKSAGDPANLLIKTPLSVNVRGPITATVLESRKETVNRIVGNDEPPLKPNQLLLGNTLDSLTSAVFSLLGGIFTPPSLNSNWQGRGLDGSASAQIETLANLYLEETKVNGFYNVDAATALLLNGKGVSGQDGYMGKLVNSDFTFNNAIPVSCLLAVCPPSQWTSGTFSRAFKAYTSTPYSILDVVGIPTLGNGYVSCSGLLTSLLAWNSCVKSNLINLLKQHSDQVSMTDGNALVQSLQNKNTTDVTCSGALCVLLKPILTPVKWLLNGLGESLLSPLLTKVLGLNVNQSQVKALEINCNAARLVY